VNTLTAPLAQIDIALSFGGVGSDRDLGVPLLTWLVDNPVWTPELVDANVARDGALVVAAEHIAVLSDFLGVALPVGFVPHGIGFDANAPAPSFGDDGRDIDVLIAASFCPRQQPPWRTDDAAVAEALRTTLRIADERWDHHVRELEVSGLFREAAGVNDLPYVPEGHRLFAPQLAWLDGHLRDRRRLACVRALDRAGIRTHLLGAGWDRLASLEHATVVGPIDHREIGSWARRAKVVANVGPPLFNHGWHERIPLAMVHGALAVTETNDWLAADRDLPACLDTYEMTGLDALADIVRGALTDPQREERTRTAYELARKSHTWAARARTVLEMVEI